jgi:hypothetical protein
VSRITGRDVAVGFARLLVQVGTAAAEAAVDSVLDDVDAGASEVQRRVRKAKAKVRKTRRPHPREDVD